MDLPGRERLVDIDRPALAVRITNPSRTEANDFFEPGLVREYNIRSAPMVQTEDQFKLNLIFDDLASLDRFVAERLAPEAEGVRPQM